MTQSRTRTPRRAAGPVPAALAGMLALAGCSATHVGESWQCPLAQGAQCTSVAAADPAVPGAGAGEAPVPRAPLYEAREPEPPVAAPMPACDAGCTGLDPLGWLARLLGTGDADPRSGPEPAEGAPFIGADAGGPTPAPVLPDIASTPEPAASPALAKETPPAGEPPAPALAGGPERAGEGVPGKGLRTGEVIGRVWIAPFVDADGVYREAAHVRVVLEPAGWRVP